MRIVQRADRATAIHESGHAIAALVNGLTVEKVTIQMPRGGNRGECSIGWNQDDADSIRNYLIAVLAGGAAQARFENRAYTGMYDERQEESGDRKLFEWQLQCYANLTGLSKERALPILHQQAEQLVAEHWPLITQLADTLMERGWVTDLRLE